MRQTCIFTRLQRWKPSRATTTATVACVPHDAHLETNGRHEERPATDSRKRWRLIACQRAAAHKDTFLSPTFGSLRRLESQPSRAPETVPDLTSSPLGRGRSRGVGMDGQRTMAKSSLIGMSRVWPVSSQRFGALRSLLLRPSSSTCRRARLSTHRQRGPPTHDVWSVLIRCPLYPYSATHAIVERWGSLSRLAHAAPFSSSRTAHHRELSQMDGDHFPVNPALTGLRFGAYSTLRWASLLVSHTFSVVNQTV